MTKRSPSDLQKTEIELKYDFSTRELADISNELAERLQRKKALDDELTTLKASYKSKFQALDEEITKFSNNISQKHEMRSTPVYLLRNYSAGVRQYLSVIDKSDILKEEPLTKEDKQLKMKLDEEEQDQ